MSAQVVTLDDNRQSLRQLGKYSREHQQFQYSVVNLRKVCLENYACKRTMLNLFRWRSSRVASSTQHWSYCEVGQEFKQHDITRHTCRKRLYSKNSFTRLNNMPSVFVNKTDHLSYRIAVIQHIDGFAIAVLELCSVSDVGGHLQQFLV